MKRSLLLVLLLLIGCPDTPASDPSIPNVPAEDMSQDLEPPVDTPDEAPDMEPLPCACVAPEPSCEDGVSRRLVEASCDDSNTCQLDARVEACDAPPQDTCEGAIAVSFSSAGQCISGACEYDRVETPCDAPPAPKCLDDTTLEVYATQGSCADGVCSYVPTTQDCGALGCCEGGCCEVTPSNGLGGLEANGVVVGPPSGTFSTSTQCTADSVLGVCQVVEVAEIDEVCVCRAERVQIQDLEIVGTRALAILASQDIEVLGTLSVAARGEENGPGFVYRYREARAPGAGGSHATRGGNFMPAELHGSETLEPLFGGMKGQDSCGRAGGGGGGAVQLTAGERVRVVGAINAGGGGGRGGPESSGCNDGAGGGAGGSVLIEAPLVEMPGVVAANGGGGGSGGSTDRTGLQGGDALASSEFARGGASQRDQTCALYPDVFSGAGGVGATQEQSAGSGGGSDSETRCIGSTYAGAGGGGGGLGRVRINTQRGAQSCLCNGVFSPGPSFGTLSLSAP